MISKNIDGFSVYFDNPLWLEVERRGKLLPDRSYNRDKKEVRISLLHIKCTVDFIHNSQSNALDKKESRNTAPLSPIFYEVNCAQNTIEVDLFVISMNLKWKTIQQMSPKWIYIANICMILSKVNPFLYRSRKILSLCSSK